MIVRSNKHLLRDIFRVSFILCFSAQTLLAALRIQPAYVEVEMDKKRLMGRFLLSNLGETEERYRINAVHFTYSETGGLKQSKTGDYSLAQWLYFNPREVTIAPKTARAVRFTVVPRGKLQEGEYWAAMELESLKVTMATSKSEETGRAIKLRAVTAIMVPIFGTMGKVSYEGVIKEVKLTIHNPAIFLEALVAATGTGRLGVKGKYEICSASGEIVDEGPFGGAYVLRGSQLWFRRKMEANLPEGLYTVKITLNAAHLEKAITKEVQLNWPKLPPKAESDDKKTILNQSKESDDETKDSKEATNKEAGTEPSSVG